MPHAEQYRPGIGTRLRRGWFDIRHSQEGKDIGALVGCGAAAVLAYLGVSKGLTRTADYLSDKGAPAPAIDRTLPDYEMGISGEITHQKTGETLWYSSLVSLECSETTLGKASVLLTGEVMVTLDTSTDVGTTFKEQLPSAAENCDIALEAIRSDKSESGPLVQAVAAMAAQYEDARFSEETGRQVRDDMRLLMGSVDLIQNP
jgi:hypothetical protein